MKQTTPKKKKIRLRILQIMLLVFCLVIVLGINKPHLPPFTAKVSFNHPNNYAVSQNNSVVVDMQGQRILIFSRDGLLTSIIDLRASGHPISKVSDITLYGDSIYLVGTKTYNEGIYLSTESIVEYSLQGKLKKTLYTQKYSEEDRVNKYRLQSIKVDPSGIAVLVNDIDKLSVCRLKDGALDCSNEITFPEAISKAYFVPNSPQLSIIGQFGSCFQVDLTDNSFRQIKPIELFGSLADRNEDLGKIASDFLQASDECMMNLSTVYNTDGSAETVTILNFNNGQTLVLTNDTASDDHLTECKCSLPLILSNTLFWIAVVAVAASALFFLGYVLVKKRSRKMLIVLGIIAGIVITSVFYTVKIDQAIDTVYRESMTIQTRQISDMLSESYGETFARLVRNDPEDFLSDPDFQKKTLELAHILKKVSDANGTLRSCIYFCYLFKDNRAYSLTDTALYFPTGYRILLLDKAMQELKRPSDTIIEYTNSVGNSLNTVGAIHAPDGQIVGMIHIASYRNNLLEVKAQSALSLALTLLALFTGIYVSISALHSGMQSFRHFKSRSKDDHDGRMVDMAGIYMFCQNIISWLDSVIIVYVTQSICGNVGPAPKVMLSAIPITVNKTGNAIGCMIVGPLCKKIGERTTTVIASFGAILASLVCMVGVYSKNLVVFSVGQFFLGLFLKGMLYVQSDTIAYHEKDPDARKKVIESVTQSSIAATILSMLLAGFISQYVSYGMVYLISACLSVSLLILSFVLFRNHKDSPAAEKTDAKPIRLRDHWLIFLKGPMLMYILCYRLPVRLFSGFRSYFFPMFTKSAGISPLLLSNLNVFVKAFSYVTAEPIRRLGSRHDPKKMMFIPVFAFSFGLMLLYLNANIYWLIVLLFATGIIQRMTSVGNNIFMAEISDAYGLNGKIVRGNFFALDIFQAPTLSALIPLGVSLGSTVLGLGCSVLFSVYALYRHFASKRKKDGQPRPDRLVKE